SGKAELGLELTQLYVNGIPYALSTSEYSEAGESRTGETVKRAGIGAGIGAVIGAIAGGGKGAAIGAGVGGGAGTATQVLTKGEKLNIPSETKIEFTLRSPLVIAARERKRVQDREIWTRFPLEALYFACLLVALKHKVPANYDDQQQRDVEVLAGDSQISAREVRRVLADHRPYQRNRHVGVVARPQSRQFDEVGIRSCSILNCTDNLLLRRPDPEPHVERHRAAKQHAGVNQYSAITEVRKVRIKSHDDR